MTIDDKNDIRKTGKSKEKVKLIFKNGSTVELTEKNDQEVWKGVTGVIIEQWLSREEIKKLYPNIEL